MWILPATRAFSDGSFSLDVCADHVYFLSVVDMQWASDTWTGVILPDEESKPVEISIQAYPATPVDFLVTRGINKQPVGNTYIGLRGEPSELTRARAAFHR